MLTKFRNRIGGMDKIRVAGGSDEKRSFLSLAGGGGGGGGGSETKRRRKSRSKKEKSSTLSPENDKDFRVIISNTAYRSQVADDRIKTLITPTPIKSASVDYRSGKKQKLMAILGGGVTIDEFFRKYAGCDIVDGFIVRNTLLVEGETMVMTPPINDIRNSRVIATICTIVPDIMSKIIDLIVSIKNDYNDSSFPSSLPKERLESLLINREKPTSDEVSVLTEMLEWCWTHTTEALSADRLFSCGFFFTNTRDECVRIDTRSVAVILNYALKRDFRNLSGIPPSPSSSSSPLLLPPPPPQKLEEARSPVPKPSTSAQKDPSLPHHPQPQPPPLPFEVSPEVEERTKKVLLAVQFENASVTKDNGGLTEETLKNKAILEMLRSGGAIPRYTSEAMRDSKILEMFSGFRATHTKQKGGRKPTKKQTTLEEREMETINDALSQGSHDLVTMKDLSGTVTRIHPNITNGGVSPSNLVFSAPFICNNFWMKKKKEEEGGNGNSLCVKETWLWPTHKLQVESCVKKLLEPPPLPSSPAPTPTPTPPQKKKRSQKSPKKTQEKRRKTTQRKEKEEKVQNDFVPSSSGGVHDGNDKKRLSAKANKRSPHVVHETPPTPSSDIPQKMINALSRDMPWIQKIVCAEFLKVRNSMIKLIGATRWDEIREYVYSRVYQEAFEKETIDLLERNPKAEFPAFSTYQEDAGDLFSPFEALEPGFLEKCRANMWKASLKFALSEEDANCDDDDGVLPKLKRRVEARASKKTISSTMLRIVSFLIHSVLKDFRSYKGGSMELYEEDLECAKRIFTRVLYPSEPIATNDNNNNDDDARKKVKEGKVDSFEDMFASFDDDEEEEEKEEEEEAPATDETVESKEPYCGIIAQGSWPINAVPLMPVSHCDAATAAEAIDPIEATDRIRVALLRHIFPSIRNLYASTPKFATREKRMRECSIESGLHSEGWLLGEGEGIMCSTRVFWFFMVTMDFIVDCDRSGPLKDPFATVATLMNKFIF